MSFSLSSLTLRKFPHLKLRCPIRPHLLHAPRASSALDPVIWARARRPWMIAYGFSSSGSEFGKFN
ncbi:hypothetical protein RchiOBHm_Chr1g0360931 [Rosa chinensis]|uniref:Uncharacterized protein n=1 Tax=Rosa chinensis TaxID=74649 RepID=A0A2P6SIT3_ROSCH|nr:hypothetical protein RchiOBHm_Chr1g0360931 [Rosa chinensis]